MSVNIANELGKRSIDNILVATYRGGILSSSLDNQTVLHVLHKKNGSDLFAFYKLVKLVYHFAPTHIHAHSTSIIWATFIRLIFPGIKLIWHDHFGLDTTLNKRSYMRWLLPFVEHNIVVKKELLNWLKQLDENIHATYIPNFTALTIPKIEKENNSLLCLANVRRQKNLETLITAVYMVHMMGISLQLRIVGHTSDTMYMTELQNMISQLNLKDSVTIAGPTDQVGIELARARAGVLSSASEGLPVSLLEYGIAGLPVAVTDVGECGEVTDRGKAGILVPARNPEALADAIVFILNNTQECDEMGKRLMQRVDQLYGPDTYMNTYLTIIH